MLMSRFVYNADYFSHDDIGMNATSHLISE